ncbi:MAG: undecaprenyldiphospho-muramoylpentapeptide beta-N-acetylglucosaminyltransferase [Candidatus Latescibacterota bacterium]|jgi:UDP-N-acetylglucosamine--N-acetylmuramyl-(pentapeptide) pyrophosphoryl-undecaprenol N-acetylglucosamine transferase
MMSRQDHNVPTILFAGGGTGGHVYPAIAIADAVRSLEPNASIAFAGTKERLEWTAVPKAGYPIHPITVSGFQRSLSPRNLTFPFKLLKGLAESWSLVGRLNPDVVVGTGGYVSGPVLWTASLRKRPTLIQEQNAYAGVTNRLLAKGASRIHIAFSEAKAYFPPEKCVESGNPVRESLRSVDRPEARRHFEIPSDARVVFVFGGSLGSAILNTAVSDQLEAILGDGSTWLIWQTGRKHFDAIEAEVSHERLRLLAYVDRMDFAYAAADIVVSRAGAITCSELMLTGTPAVLVPARALAEDHQTKNAKALADRGAAILLAEPELDELSSTLAGVLAEGDRLASMSETLRSLAKPDAARDIAKDVLGLVGVSR